MYQQIYEHLLSEINMKNVSTCNMVHCHDVSIQNNAADSE